MLFKVKASQEVVKKGPEASGTRRRTVSTPTGPRSLTFGREPVYLRCETLPKEIAGDQYLLATPIEAVDPGVLVIDLDLKAERVQEPEAATGPLATADEITPPATKRKKT